MSTQVLEAVLVVSIMVSAVAFVVTYDAPPTGASGAREGLETRAQDALAILHDTPISSRFGENELSAFIAECMNKRCDNLSTRIEQLVPPGASYALYISNGVDTYPVIVEGLPTGEAVTATQPFEPRWSSTFVETATEAVSQTSPLLVYALPSFHSNPLTPGGSQLMVRVSGTRTADGADYTLTGSYATVAQSEDDPTAFASSLYFVDDVGVPTGTYDLTVPRGVPAELVLRVAESEGTASIPAGTEVDVHLPRGFTAVADPAKNPGWNVLASATNKNGVAVGSTLRANLSAPIVGGARNLVLNVTYHGDVLDIYPIVATMSKGATATASVLIHAEDHSSNPEQATPLLHLSVPSPLGKGASTTWTLGAYVPMGGMTDDNLPRKVVMKTVEIIEKDGHDIFDCSVPSGQTHAVRSITLANGNWSCHADMIVWEGIAELHYDELLDLAFDVRASGIAGPHDARAPFMPPVDFAGHSTRLTERTGWGFTRGVVLPADANYEGHPGNVADGHLLRSDGTYRNTLLPGSTRYNVSALAAVQDSLFGSHVSAEDRNVPAGGEVVISADVQSVLYALADAGQRAGVTMRFYPPWSGDERIPIYEQRNLDQGILSAEVAEMVVLDVNDDGFPDPIVGTSNGRVMAFHGLTGLRLQGSSFAAPLASATQVSGSAKILGMETLRHGGKDHVVVAFDKNAASNLYVLHKNLTRAAESGLTGVISAIDTRVDIDGDGERDIVAVDSYQEGATNAARVFAFRLESDRSRLVKIDTPLEHDALANVVGTPTTVAAVARAGPWGATTGVLVPVQTLYEPGVKLNPGAQPPLPSLGTGSLPRAGVAAANRHAEQTSTLFGAPVSVVRSYDYGGDAVDDAVFGGSSGYVIMANGTALTQPIYSYFAVNGKLVDGEARSSTEAYTLTADGTVIYTDDAWITSYYSHSQFPGAKAISSNETGHYWVVGPANGVWRSVKHPSPDPDPRLASAPEQYDFMPLPLVSGTKGTANYSFVLNVHEFRDVHAAGATIHVVGAKCLIVGCTEPPLLRTTDGGATWRLLTFDDASLLSAEATAEDADLNAIQFIAGTGWIVGDGGTLLRSLTGGATWLGVGSGTTYDLLDIDCKPSDPTTCLVVGEAGAAFRITNALGAAPVWENLTGKWGLPADRPLYTVGYVEDERMYIGSNNTVLASFWGANWTALPLNYIENDAYAVATAGDGSGFLFGGGTGNMRIWLLHDYATQSRAVTTSLQGHFETDARIVSVTLTDSNVTVGQQKIEINVTRGDGWRALGTLIKGAPDARNVIATPGFTIFDPEQPGRDLRFNITMNTSGAFTILSPHIRELTFQVQYLTGFPTPVTKDRSITLDFETTTYRDDALTTADWDTKIGALRQPFVREYWTRNVSGQVYDIQTGYSVTGDARDEVWVSTGDILAENSPDHVIYAGTNLSKLVGSDDRVYLLDGRNGNTTRISAPLEGEVRQIRLVDHDGNRWPEILFAVTWNGTQGRLYGLNASTLVELWNTSLGAELPADLELGRASADHASAFVGTTRAADVTRTVGQLWAINASSHRSMWSVIPDDMGKYLVAAQIPSGWLFGPYVVEVEVEWEETVTSEGVAETILRSARFYDHFMVTPPGAVSSPTPVYTAKLLVWMRDWA